MIEILDSEIDRARIGELIASGSGIRLVDAFESGMLELADLEPDSLSSPASCRYVYFPWRNALVTLPDSEIFWRLRTARNRYLIDESEQRRWSDALIGIAGLSVGAAVLSVCSLTGARRFRLAEHDTLGTTNLNRLVGSVCDLGASKLTLAQRRTLETDPYSEITGFPNGYSPEVADAFLGTGERERLTVLLEEMDNLAMKIDIRLRARESRIPVVMVTDNGDNAILDVERFDLEPDYPLFHGLAGDLTARTAAELNDPAQRVRIASSIVGSAVTPRTRYSLTQVGRTIPSWPQLGTAATLSGAVGALAARLIACGTPLASGRYRVDLDHILLGEAALTAERWNELDEPEFRATLDAALGV